MLAAFNLTTDDASTPSARTFARFCEDIQADIAPLLRSEDGASMRSGPAELSQLRRLAAAVITRAILDLCEAPIGSRLFREAAAFFFDFDSSLELYARLLDADECAMQKQVRLLVEHRRRSGGKPVQIKSHHGPVRPLTECYTNNSTAQDVSECHEQTPGHRREAVAGAHHSRGGG